MEFQGVGNATNSVANTLSGNFGSSGWDQFRNWFTNQNGWTNLFLPGFSALDQMFDFTGKYAAQNQYAAQLALQREAQAYNSAEAEKQRQWEKTLSDTAMERQVEDLKRAGLNPWLALGSGSAQGATTPSGSSASSNSGQAAKADNKLATAAAIFATALRIFLAKH